MVGVKEVKGDVTEAYAMPIIHGCNCLAIMGAGVAAQIAKKFPAASYVDRGTKPRLGDYSYCVTPNESLSEIRYIFNAYTQVQPGPNAQIWAIATSLDKICRDFPQFLSFAMPRIGCGIGGLEWLDVKFALDAVAYTNNRQFVVYVLPETVEF